MNKHVKNILILVLLYSVPACYTPNLVTSSEQMKREDEAGIISMTINDGRIIENKRPMILYNSPKGVYIIDSSGTRIIKHDEIRSITFKSADIGKTVWLGAGIGLGAFLIYMIYGFTHLRLAG